MIPCDGIFFVVGSFRSVILYISSDYLNVKLYEVPKLDFLNELHVLVNWSTQKGY